MMIKILIVLAIIVLACFVLEIAVVMMYVILELTSALLDNLPDWVDEVKRTWRGWKSCMQLTVLKRRARRNTGRVRRKKGDV